MNLSLLSLSSFVLLASLKATLLVALVLLLQRVAGTYLSAGARYLLWLTVVISLVTPIGFDTTLPAGLMDESAPEFLPLAQATDTSDAAVVTETRSAGVSTMPGEFVATFANARPAVSAVAPLDWLALLPYVWLGGVMMVCSAIAVSGYRFARLVRRATAAPDDIQRFLADCMRQTACKARVNVLHSTEVQVPMIAGLFRPVLLLPTGMEQQVSREQLRHVFIHELMHLQRGDIVSNWIVALVQALHWFNPVVWYAFFCMRQDRELACDAATLQHLAPNDRAAYGHTLLQLNATLPQTPVPTLALGILDASSHLQQRILMLVQPSRYKRLQTFVSALLFLPLAAVAFSQPAPRMAEPVSAVAGPAAVIAEPVVAAVEPASTIAEPVAPVAEPATRPTVPTQATVPPPAEAVVPAQTAPAVPTREVRSPEPTVANALLLAQLEATPVAAPFDAAAGTTDIAAAITAQAPAELDADLSAAIQQLAEHISAARSASMRFMEDLDSTATECAAKGDGIRATLSAACTKTRRALRTGGSVFRFGYQCFMLDTRQAALTAARQRETSTQQPVVDNLLRENEQNLAAFCNKETYGEQYPVFAALVPVEEYTQDYVLTERRRVARALPGNSVSRHGEINPGVMASSMFNDPSRPPAADYTQGGTCCSGNTQATYGTGFGPSDFGGGAAAPAGGGGEAQSAPAP